MRTKLREIDAFPGSGALRAEASLDDLLTELHGFRQQIDTQHTGLPGNLVDQSFHFGTVSRAMLGANASAEQLLVIRCHHQRTGRRPASQVDVAVGERTVGEHHAHVAES